MLNPVLLEMATLYTGDPFDFLMEDDDDHSLMHYGVGPDDNPPGRGSGRYEKGSGEEPYQHGIGSFLERVDFYKNVKHVTNQKELAQLCGCKNTTDFRLEYTKALHAWKQERAAKAQAMINSGKSKKAVAEHFGIRESTLSSWLNPKSLERVSAAQKTADFLEDQVKQKGMIEVGAGVEKELGVPRTKFSEALSLLESKGYNVFGGRVPQATNPGKKTTITVLATPDGKWSDVYNHPEKIQSVKDYICREGDDGEDVFEKKWQYPSSMDSKRLLIRYADDVAPDGHTGLEKDGTIEIRRNVPDLSLNGSHYAQVRIMVDNSKYLKGMALYSDHIPDGYDVVFNTNKSREKNDMNSVLKDIKKDPDNPFGALLRNEGGQYTYTDENGNRQLGLINKTRHEGDWEDWKDSLPSQFLAKQPMALIEKQLGKALEEKKSELADIMSLTNPTLKKSLLNDFAEGCDHDAVHMSAAALPRQKYQVILPIPTLADNEVYAPNFHDGETIACVRFPHGGLFEIAILKVNNRNPQGQELIGKNPIDAIGLNKKNADRLSGADFDGDTVMCIPCNDPRYSDTRIQDMPPLPGLEGFDSKQYQFDYKESRMERVKKKDGTYEMKEVTHYFRDGQEFKPMTRTGLEMGNVSNLIMDMTLKGAGPDDLAAAVRHSMVVIDAEKHHLDWKQSEIDNHIRELKKKYQERIDDEDGSVHYGASTLITRAKSPTQVIKPTGSPHIDPETGRLYYTDKQLEPQTYTDKDGKTKIRMEDVALLDTKKSAFELVSTYDPKHPDKTFILSPKEAAYAQYSDTLRAMANEARKEIISTGDIQFNREAEKQYHEEAEHLLSELMIAELNAPRERMAQLYARGVVLAKKRDNPDMTKKEIKKASQEALANGRLRFGASRHKIDITPKEWEAIQSGAINKTKLTGLLQYADPDKVREYATPHQGVALTSGQQSRLKNLLKNPNVSVESIAETMHISISTVHKYQKELGVI